MLVLPSGTMQAQNNLMNIVSDRVRVLTKGGDALNFSCAVPFPLRKNKTSGPDQFDVLLKVSANLPFSLFPHKQRQQQLTSQVNSTKPETNNLLLYTGRTRSSTCFIFYPLSAFQISKWAAALKKNLEIYILLLLHSSVTFLFWMMDSHPNSAFSVKVIKFWLLYEAPFLCLVFWTFLNSLRWAKRHTGPFLIEFKDRCSTLKVRL